MEPSEVLKLIDWGKSPLIVAIAQDELSGEVLMQAFMNEEALSLTLSSGFVHYYSRSKGRIWKKGEQSGHTQELVDALLDCDGDSLLLKVKQTGVACHTGRQSCFFTSLKSGEIVSQPILQSEDIYGIVDTIFHTIEERRRAGDAESSYVAKLFSKGENTIAKKIIEEAGEFALSLKDKDEKESVYEAADLLFHALVGLSFAGISPDKVRQELARRHGTSGIAEKNSRKE